MSSDIHSVLVGEVWRMRAMVAKESGSAITSGTVNYYLLALTGDHAGKWWKNSDQSWAVAETANAMTHQIRAFWTIQLAASPFVDGVVYIEYAEESEDLHVAGEGRMLRGETNHVPADYADAWTARNIDGGANGGQTNGKTMAIISHWEIDKQTGILTAYTDAGAVACQRRLTPDAAGEPIISSVPV